MNKFYLIIPLVLTIAFGGIYVSHRKAEAARADVRRVELARAEADALARKQDAERQAREDADRRSAERVAEEKRKEDEKRAKWEATGRELAAETAEYRAQVGKHTAEVAALTARLDTLRVEKDAAGRAEFAQALEIERERVRKRNAELDIQRLVEAVARKNYGSDWRWPSDIQRLVEAVARKGTGSTLGVVGAIP